MKHTTAKTNADSKKQKKAKPMTERQRAKALEQYYNKYWCK